MSRVLVTGAGGFIGSRLVSLLVKAGHEVHAVTSREPPEAAEIEWHRADLLEPAAAEPLIAAASPDRLVHLAWLMDHGRFWNGLENLDWVEASLRLWRAFASSGGRRALMIGSCAEYEWSDDPLSERSTPLRPETLYGACKDALRRIVESAAAEAGLSQAWARLLFVYGPEDDSDRLVPSIVSALRAGRPAPTSDGSLARDFIHVDDVAGALARLLDSDVEGAVNVGTGEGFTIREVAETLGELAGRPDLVEVGALPRRPQDPERIVADVTRLADEVGWTDSMGLREGLSLALAGIERAESNPP